ncbi:MAG: hypothetical protein MR717_08685, partial [Prevotella sp.]|nr:hypothetical protein [Prevotella sp.]
CAYDIHVIHIQYFRNNQLFIKVAKRLSLSPWFVKYLFISVLTLHQGDRRFEKGAETASL